MEAVYTAVFELQCLKSVNRTQLKHGRHTSLPFRSECGLTLWFLVVHAGSDGVRGGLGPLHLALLTDGHRGSESPQPAG